jgi:hypothetical protein
LLCIQRRLRDIHQTENIGHLLPPLPALILPGHEMPVLSIDDNTAG